MSDRFSRRMMLAAGSQVAAGVFALSAFGREARQEKPQGWPPRDPRISNGTPRPPIDPKTVPNKGPALPSTIAFEFVYFAHTKLEVVRDMLADNPTLVNAAWDWGGGDWETALGAAGHMGRRDIAEFLIENGARIELPAAVMLGELALVKAAIEAFPRAAKIPGPHGIPLMAHAKKGGERAAAVAAYLEALEKGQK